MAKNTQDLLEFISKSIQSDQSSEEAVVSEVKNLSGQIKDKLDELIDISVIGFKRLEKKTAPDTTQTMNIGLGRVTKAVNEVERAVKTLSLNEKNDTEEYKPIVDSVKSLQKSFESKSSDLPRTPKDPIAVRLSDGDKWIEQATQIIREIRGGSTGGGISVPRVNGTDSAEYVPTMNGLFIPKFDYVSNTINSATETYVFKQGGSTGSTVAKVVIVYTDSGRTDISTVTKTNS